MVEKILRAKCRYCGKKVFSLYEGQLKYNIQAHEISCPERKKDKKIKRDPSSDESQGNDSMIKNKSKERKHG